MPKNLPNHKVLGNFCYISGMLEHKTLSKDTIVSIIRSSWQSSVLAIIYSERDGISYNGLLYDSGLNPRTLSLVLRKMAENGFISKQYISKKPIHTKYTITSLGASIAVAQCPLISIKEQKMGELSLHKVEQNKVRKPLLKKTSYKG